MGVTEPHGLVAASTRRRDHPNPRRSFSGTNFGPLPAHLGKRMGSSRGPKTRRKLDDVHYQSHFPDLPYVSHSFHILVQPFIISRAGGTVRLRNLNPFDLPIVDPNFLSTDFDIKTMVAAIKAAKRFITAKAWREFVIAPWEPLASANTDEEIAKYARKYSSTYVGPLDCFPL